MTLEEFHKNECREYELLNHLPLGSISWKRLLSEKGIKIINKL